ncbi:MAG TPA: FAD-dependent oxidoreductase [Polyangium sp.]|nr:FAD-dependent oxidoreductase [Polyangium sp.]
MIKSAAKERVDVVIVGAGVIGASVAYHLAKRGAGSILVVEKESSPGRGSTRRATGGYRAQYSSEINVRLSLLARDALLRFSKETGIDPGYRPVGYLWIASSPEEYDDLIRAQSIQRNAGLEESFIFDPQQVLEKNPFVDPQGIVGGAFCQTDGFIRPLDILRGYLESALRLGVRFMFDTTISSFNRTSTGHIHTLFSENGLTIETRAVVDAAGAWAQNISQLAGINLPVVPLRRQVALTEPCSLLPDDMPLTIFMSDGFHLRVRDGRVMLLRPTPGHSDDPFDTRVETTWLDETLAIAKRRIPCLAHVRIDPELCWAGLYEMSPDKHALLGPAPGCPNLYFVNGSSGHGVMHSPALGLLLAEMIVDGNASSLDVSSLRPTRFAEGKPIVCSDRL